MTRYHLDAYGALASVRDQMASFFRSSFPLADPKLDAAVHDTIERFGLLAPPVVEATFPYEEAASTPRTVEELGERGVLHRDLWRILDSAAGEARWPRTRPLYKHQVDAFQAYRAGNSLVVSSGTGSGKTECFLLPSIDTVLRDEDISRPGVRVLIVYPLNALVNNQMERLRALLGHHPHIRFGLYTRRLPEKRKDAERRARKSGRSLLPAEVHSRQELRAAPPHILITNYSMLEYALVRSADAPIFSSTFAKPRLVVLDEAHVYAGAMAAEITLLLRRAWLRWQLDAAPQGIMTSATMQQGIPDGKERLLSFAADMLSKQRSQMCLVTGRREEPDESGDSVDVSLPDAKAVAALDADVPTLRDLERPEGPVTVLEDGEAARNAALAMATALNPGSIDSIRSGTPAARILWEALHPLAWMRSLRRDLHSGVMRVDELARRLFPTADAELGRRASIRILEILAIARRSTTEPPLLPVRLHGTVRGPHGVYACIRPTCDGAAVPGRIGRIYADPTERCSCGAFVAELRACQACGQAFYTMAKATDDDYFPALRPHDREAVDLFVPDGNTWDDGSPLRGGSPLHVLADGRIANGNAIGLRQFKGGLLHGPTQRLLEVPCPKCEEKPGRDRPIIRRIESGTTAVLQVLVDSLYPHLPQHRDAPEKLRGAGRRVLLFADNRQVAASLAAQVEESHDVIAARRLLLQALKEAVKTSALPPETQALHVRLNAAMAAGNSSAIAQIFAEMQAAASSVGPRTIGFIDLAHAIAGHGAFQQLSAYERDVVDSLPAFVIARELGRRPSRLGNLEANGLATVDYVLDLRRPRDSDIDAAFPGKMWRDLVSIVLDMLRTAGAIRLPTLHEQLRELLPSWLTGRTVEEYARAGQDDTEEDDDDAERERKKVIPLVPAPGHGNRRSAWINRVCAAMNTLPSVQPGLVLREIWGALYDAAGVEGASIERVTGTATNQLRIALEKLRFAVPSPGSRLQCNRCKTIWSRHVAYVCPTASCEGRLAPLEELASRDRLVALAEDSSPILGLRTHEHTAQIGVDALEDFERRFKKGEINLLVCSTTMELGVDIGGLSATILTNVPPSPSNYLQRAGRAGRRAEGTSLVLTYARPRPYDQAAFENPDRPFLDKITPPQVKLDSRRIVQRHVNAMLLATFFARARAFASEANPMAAFGEVNTFADEPLEKSLCAQPMVVTSLKEELAIDPSQSTLADAFIRWAAEVAANDDEVGDAVETVIRGTALEQKSVGAICSESARGLNDILDRIRKQLQYLRSQLEEERAKSESDRDRERTKAIQIAIADLAKEKLLAYLAEQQFLPRYGFPINVCRLHETWQKSDKEEERLATEELDDRQLELRLERDVAVALSEYAPGAEVVAGKYVHASRGLIANWTGTDAPGVLTKRAIGVCGTCGRLQQGRNEADIASTCQTCGEEGVRRMDVVHPSGFAVKWGRKPRRWIGGARPPTRPITEASYAARRDDSEVRVSDDLILAYDEEGEIVVRSEGDLAETDHSGDDHDTGALRAGCGYAVCYLCGRAEPEQHPWQNKPTPLPPELVGHERLRGGMPCLPVNKHWRHVVLAGAVRTETLRFVVEPLAPLGTSRRGRSLATTLMVAMQLCAGEVLGVDSREIGGILSPRHTGAGAVFDVVLYDTRAGGSGHCRALLDRWADLIKAIRVRLNCSNQRCTRACPKCLIAFETQRHIDLLDRPALIRLLEDRWESLQRRIVRDGIPVARLHRGGIELGEAISRAKGTRVTVVVPSIAPDSLTETGWLRKLKRSCPPGALRLVISRVPDPKNDADRFLVERLRPDIEAGEVIVMLANPEKIAALPWRVAIGTEAVYHLDGGEDDALGPHWLDGATIHRAMTDTGRIVQRIEDIALSAKLLDAEKLKAPPVPPTMVMHKVAKSLRGENATFSRWFRGPDGRSLFEKPLRSLMITDPYLATKWQIGLLRELVELARAAGCETVVVNTYPPKDEDSSSALSPREQVERIAHVLGKPGWRPLPIPHNKIDRIHQRVVKGERADGTVFEVFLERGLDFIAENYSRGRSERVTRESYLVVRDPA